MFCPECGKPIEDADVNFCIWCGKDLSSRLRSEPMEPVAETVAEQNEETSADTQWTSSPPQYQYPSSYAPPYIENTKKKKSVIGPAIGALFIVLVIIMASLSAMGGIYLPETPEENKTVTDNTLFQDKIVYVSGAFADDIFTYETGMRTFDEKKGLEKCMIYKLNPDIASKYGYFKWTFYDNDHAPYRAYLYDWNTEKYTEVTVTNSDAKQSFVFYAYNGNEVVKNEAALYWSGYDDVGDFTVSVSCFASEFAYNANKTGYGVPTYTGNYKCIGKLDRNYTWTYKGNDYNLSTTFEYNEFKKYKDDSYVQRNASISEYSIFNDYMVVNDTVTDISSKLAGEYKRIKGANADLTGQDYAEFILAYVQICFGYPPNDGLTSGDKMMYGVDDYFAYPMETIYYGVGDCEDTSILAAVLYKASGYKSAIGLLPGHAVVGVSIENYVTSGTIPSNMTVYTKTVGDEKYYAGETTADNYIQLGLLYKTSVDFTKVDSYKLKYYTFYPV